MARSVFNLSSRPSPVVRWLASTGALLLALGACSRQRTPAPDQQQPASAATAADEPPDLERGAEVNDESAGVKEEESEDPTDEAADEKGSQRDEAEDDDYE